MTSRPGRVTNLSFVALALVGLALVALVERLRGAPSVASTWGLLREGHGLSSALLHGRYSVPLAGALALLYAALIFVVARIGLRRRLSREAGKASTEVE